jgi:hypothetical protein
MATNDVERLRELLEDRFPDGSYSILKPRTETGSWFLDVSLKGYDLVIQWRPGRGFGLSTPVSHDSGSGPDEVYEDVDSAYERAKALLLSQTPTRPPTRATLPQAELASGLSSNQGTASHSRRRNDVRLGTLHSLVSAMGGELQVLAQFPDRTIPIQIDKLLSSD